MTDDVFARLQSAAHSGAFGVNELPLPSAEQCRAGNYLKGRVKLHGMPVAIEVPQGQRRMGKSDGKPWSTILMAHYGYFVGTAGADGDALDVFIGPVPESNRAWVVNQVGKDGAFDEHKILIGFIDEQSARAAYMNSYERGWGGLGSIVPCSIFQLKWWIKYGNTTKPLTEQSLPHDGDVEMNEIIWDSTSMPVGQTVPDLIYRLRRGDPEGAMLDAASLDEILSVSEGEETLDSIIVDAGLVDVSAQQIFEAMKMESLGVSPCCVQVTQPFRHRGATSVVFLYELSDGQTVSIWLNSPGASATELMAWCWMLNKKDITDIVCPEKGVPASPLELAKRVMVLAQQNSTRFADANSQRAARMQGIESMKASVAAKEAEISAQDVLISELTGKAEAKRNFSPATLQTNDQGTEMPSRVTNVAVATTEPVPAVVEHQAT